VAFAHLIFIANELGKGTNMIYYIEHPSPLGQLLLAATEVGICGVYFEEHRHFKGKDGWQSAAAETPAYAHLSRAARQLNAYFAGGLKDFDVPLDLSGTAFQQKVWDALRAIPFGRSFTYAQHAQGLGNPNALRAVGAAIGRNPVSIIVPCHRVIGSSGEVTGYAGGLERKRYLLALEGIAVK
jgi:methylated-DNA-[protein]-cysteine S-methyltransferase